MIDKDKNLYATLIINSLNDAAARASYCDVTKDEFVDLAQNAYMLMSNNINFDIPKAPVNVEVPNVPVEKTIDLKVGQVYDVADYGSGRCVITKVEVSHVNFKWIEGTYDCEVGYEFDGAGHDFFNRDDVKLVSNLPEPAIGQIWKGREGSGDYYLLVKRCDKTNPFHSNNDGWEIKASNDLKAPFRWLNDLNWKCKEHYLVFIGYKDDPLLDKIEGITS